MNSEEWNPCIAMELRKEMLTPSGGLIGPETLAFSLQGIIDDELDLPPHVMQLVYTTARAVSGIIGIWHSWGVGSDMPDLVDLERRMVAAAFAVGQYQEAEQDLAD